MKQQHLTGPAVHIAGVRAEGDRAFQDRIPEEKNPYKDTLLVVPDGENIPLGPIWLEAYRERQALYTPNEE